MSILKAVITIGSGCPICAPTAKGSSGTDSVGRRAGERAQVCALAAVHSFLHKLQIAAPHSFHHKLHDFH
jgi:hypothetical protein